MAVIILSGATAHGGLSDGGKLKKEERLRSLSGGEEEWQEERE